MKTAEEILKNKGSDMFWVEHDAVVCDALKVMTDNRIGAILVKREGNIAGIWTERDLMRNCLLEDFDHKKTTVGELMTTNLQFAKSTANLYELMDKFLGKRVRHLLIEQNGGFIGLLSSGDVMRAILSDKDDELKRLNAMVSWDYYENWRWEKNRVPPIIHNEEGLRVGI
jgi:signal-transduction protein with cAMP-binding, CBS, and nucleotidyltransferase domain